MIKIYFTLICLVVVKLSFGQIYCGTPVPATDPLSNVNQNSARTAAAQCYTITVFFHLVNKSNGTGGQSTSVINTVMTNLASAYNPQGIWFYQAGHDVINNDAYYSTDFTISNTAAYQNLFNQLVATNVQANALNIYLLGDNGTFNGGQAAGIPATACVVGGSYSAQNQFPNAGSSVQSFVPSFVAAHEVGHCLGLFHTFETQFGGELVNESNCANAGDLVCDTPAESPNYRFQDNSSCGWTVTYYDANSQAYNPDPHNIMGYTRPSCLSYVTNGQGARFRALIGTSTVLSSVRSTSVPQLPTLTLSASITPICVGQSIGAIATPTTQAYFGYATITWSANTPSYLSVDGSGNSVSITGVKQTPTGTYASFTATATDALCGTSSTTLWDVIVGPRCGGGGTNVVAFPNPSTNKLTITATSSTGVQTDDDSSASDATTTNPATNFSVRLLNSQGTTVAIGSSNKGQLTIDTSSLPPGIYFLHVTTKDSTIEKRVVITR